MWDGEAEYDDDAVDPDGSEEAQERGTRGGSYADRPAACRVGGRAWHGAMLGGASIGLRLVRTLLRDGLALDPVQRDFEDVDRAGNAWLAGSVPGADGSADMAVWKLGPDGVVADGFPVRPDTYDAFGAVDDYADCLTIDANANVWVGGHAQTEDGAMRVAGVVMYE